MKAAFFALAAAGLVAAQNLSGVPECAVKCITDGIKETNCDPTDSGCLCSAETQSKLAAAAGPCLQKACSSSDLLKALDAAGALCVAYSATAGSGTAVATASSTASETGTTTKETTKETTAAALTSSSALTPTKNATKSSEATKTESGSSSETTGSGSSSGSGSGSGGSSTTGSASPSQTNAAAIAGPAVGALLAVFAAALAL
ncbi:hypothetical protein BKA56DRAFT_591927 [Ilyonectria sp. MPI-CAGE-AT-0026]|nr:hypothetical protein BKA56DRAFT_591927 [Ilyonectria sp. MPI-CAGE-AT-0026]